MNELFQSLIEAYSTDTVDDWLCAECGCLTQDHKNALLTRILDWAIAQRKPQYIIAVLDAATLTYGTRLGDAFLERVIPLLNAHNYAVRYQAYYTIRDAVTPSTAPHAQGALRHKRDPDLLIAYIGIARHINLAQDPACWRRIRRASKYRPYADRVAQILMQHAMLGEPRAIRLLLKMAPSQSVIQALCRHALLKNSRAIQRRLRQIATQNPRYAELIEFYQQTEPVLWRVQQKCKAP